jgi:hypothetical protein
MVNGSVTSLGYCDADPSMVEGALVTLYTYSGDVITTTTDATGYYQWWLDESETPMDISVDVPEHISGFAQGVVVIGGQTTTVNFDLRYDYPCVGVSPDGMSAIFQWGENSTQAMTITNSGADDLNFQLVERDRGWNPGINIPRFEGTLPIDTRPVSIERAPNAGTGGQSALPLNNPLAGPPAFAMDVYPGYNLVNFPDLEVPGTWNVVANIAGNQYFAGDFINGDFSTLYVIDYGTTSLYAIDTATGGVTLIGPSTPYGGESWTGMTGANDGTMYASSTNISRSTLYTIDLGTGVATVIGEITNAPAIIDIAINANGEMFGVDIVSDVLAQIDPATGAGTIIGSLGASANYAQGMDFDEETGILYWAAYTSSGELRIIDTSTGASILVGGFPGGAEVDSFAIATGGAAGDVPWLIEDVITGTIPADFGSQTINVTLDSAVVSQPGDYFATLAVKSNDPVRGTVNLPITMTVIAGADMGQFTGFVWDSCQGTPLADVEVNIIGGDPIGTTYTDIYGEYEAWLVEGTYTVQFNLNGYLTYETEVTITAGEVTSLDVNLIPDAPCILVTPDVLEVWVPVGTAAYPSTGMDIYNFGGADLTFELRERNGDYTPGALESAIPPTPLAPVANPGSTSTVNPTALPSSVINGGIPEAWLAGAPMPGMGLVRYAHTQCPGDTDNFYIISGVENGSQVNYNYRYTASTNTWATLNPIPVSTEGPQAVCYEDMIYVVVGSVAGAPSSLYIYDTLADTWTAGSPAPRGTWGAVMGAFDGKVYLVSGANDFSGSNNSDEVNIYDVASDTWIGNGTPIPTARGTAGFVQLGEFLYVVGGWGDFAPGSNSYATERYDMSSDSWEVGPSFSIGKADFGLTATSQYLYAIAGDADGSAYFDATNSVWVYDWTAWPSGAWYDLGDPIPTAVSANSGAFTTDAVTGGEVWTSGGMSSFVWQTQNVYRAAEAPWTPGPTDVPWMWEDPITGTVSAGDMLHIEVSFTSLYSDTTPMPVGTYTATLRIMNNDAVAGTQTIQIIMHVIGSFWTYLPFLPK